MPRQRKGNAESSVFVSILFHTALFGAMFYFAARQGLIPDKVARAFNIQPVPKKKEPDPPPKPVPPTKQEVAAAAPPSDAPPPTTPQTPTAAPPVTARQAAPGAVSIGGNSAFQAQARPAGQPPAPAIQTQTRPGTSAAPPPAPRRVNAAPTGPVSAFSASAGKPSTIASVLEERKTAAAVQDAFSADQISRSLTRDVGEVVAKITGASVVDGKTAVVRGLSDRYTAATLNGAEVPSADAYRKSAQLDLFNANMIDRVTTTKTFTPDLPGGFAGGSINIVTKSFPARRFANLSIGTSFNPQVQGGSDFLSYDGGGHDWAAMDDGSRALPKTLLDPKTLSSNAIRSESEARRVDGLNTSFRSTQLAPVMDHSAPINNSFSLSFGDTTRLWGRPFGYFSGISWNRSFRQTKEGKSGDFDGDLNPIRAFPVDVRSGADASWSATASVASLLHPHHELAFTFLWNQTAEDNVLKRDGRDFSTGSGEEEVLHHNSIQFIERQIHTFQLRGVHQFPDLHRSYVEWTAALSNTSQEEPDLRIFNYFSYKQEDGTVLNSLGQNTLYPNFPTRIFRLLNEDNRNVKLDYHLPFHQWNGLESEFKFGGYHSLSERRFNERTFVFRADAPQGDDDTFKNNGQPNNFLDPQNLGFIKDGDSFLLNRRLNADPQIGNQRYEGMQQVDAAYLMLDLPLATRLRLTGGARLETTSLNIASASQAVTVASEPLDTADWLPALGFLYQVTSNVTFRLNYGRTIARPTYRERAAYRSYDPIRNQLVDGNPKLGRTTIDNYDVRLEWFPNPGEVISLGAFHKSLRDPIEQVQVSLIDSIISFVNRERATVRGVEFEVRKSLAWLEPNLSNFSLGINAAYLQSEVTFTQAEAAAKKALTRPLYDQSPYIINCDLSYDNPRKGTLLTFLVNFTGERIFLATPAGPDIYENPPLTFDISLSQRIRRNMKLRLSAQNILDSKSTRTYGAGNENYIYSSFRMGRAFSLGLNYEF